MKENKTGGHTLHDFKIYYKFQQSQQCGTGTQADIQTNGTKQSSETNPHIHGQMMFDRTPRPFNGKRTTFSTNGARKTGYPQAKE